MQRRNFLQNLAIGSLASDLVVSGVWASETAQGNAGNPLSLVTHPISKRKLPALATGVIVPVFTPAKEGGRLDSKGLENYLNWLVEDPHTHGLFVRSGVGCMYSYTPQEVREAIDITVETVAGRKHVLFGTFGIYDGDTDHRPEPERYIAESIEFSQYAEEKGTTGIVLLSPYMLLPKEGETTQDVVASYIKEVAGSVRLPVMVYNPGSIDPGYYITSHLVPRLLEIPNLVAAKISTNDMAWLARVEAALADTTFALIPGSEQVFYHMLLTGSLGIIGAGCNVYPSILDAVYTRFLEEDYTGARQAQMDANDAFVYIDWVPQSIGGLAYLRVKGLDVQPWDKSGEPLLSDAKIATAIEGLDRLISKYG